MLTGCDVTVDTVSSTSKAFRLGAASGGKKNFNKGANCKTVTNTGANIVFVPLKTSYEWSSMIDSGIKPSYLSISDCGGSCTINKFEKNILGNTVYTDNVTITNSASSNSVCSYSFQIYSGAGGPILTMNGSAMPGQTIVVSDISTPHDNSTYSTQLTNISVVCPANAPNKNADCSTSSPSSYSSWTASACICSP